ncbi:Leucine-rich repeat protein kinase family protein [Euphorbia peplus]|nr:Leucine-rich repeat protein kinase family protein [Euphorbia peplus]
MPTQPKLQNGCKTLEDQCFLEMKATCTFEVLLIWNPMKLLIFCLIFLSFLTVVYPATEPDFEGEALIELLRALNDTNNQIKDWNIFLVSPCESWSHIICRNGSVISLSLASNGFSGTLSPAICTLKSLVSLELQNNNLSGPLPEYLADMTHLETLNLANNKFSGSIPITWGRLSKLKHLDVSANDLVGQVPENLFSVPEFNFTGTGIKCGSRLEEPCTSRSPFSVSNSKSRLRIIVIATSCGISILLLLGFAYRYHQLQSQNPDIFVDVPGEDDRRISFGHIKRFSWRELQLATDNFSESNVIGQGGFGKVYKGVLGDNTRVAVKRLSDYSPGGEASFQREVLLVSIAVHRNLLRLIGFCTTSSERILVYPYMPNLSVAYHLRDLKPGEKGLDWRTRKHVAFEYLSTGKATEKTDVFGYGITLLELVTGQRAIDLSRLEDEEDVLLVDHIKKLLKENRLEDIVDKSLKVYECKEVETIVKVALLCTQSQPEQRPTMAEVVKMLQGVDLTERWAEWKQVEDARSQDFSLTFVWPEDMSVDQEAIQLSKAR